MAGSGHWLCEARSARGDGEHRCRMVGDLGAPMRISSSQSNAKMVDCWRLPATTTVAGKTFLVCVIWPCYRGVSTITI
jgi:hypothetical protein